MVVVERKLGQVVGNVVYERELVRGLLVELHLFDNVVDHLALLKVDQSIDNVRIAVLDKRQVRQVHAPTRMDLDDGHTHQKTRYGYRCNRARARERYIRRTRMVRKVAQSVVLLADSWHTRSRSS